MKIDEFLNIVRGNLIVSCQALEGEPLYIEGDSIMNLMAKAAKLGGAKAIRTNGVTDVKKIKEETNMPIIGLIKKSYKGFDQYITVTMNEIDKLVEAGADVIALDCTLRERGDGKTVKEFINEIKIKYPNILLMADISNLEEGINAWESGVDIVGTTLSGYTPYTKKRNEPDYELVKNLAKNIEIPVIAEGRIHNPDQAKKMLELGATSVVVGGAITRPLEITRRFVKEIKGK